MVNNDKENNKNKPPLLKHQSSVAQLIKQFSSPKIDPRSRNEVLSLSEHRMMLRYGYNLSYLEDAHVLANLGFGLFSRAKIWDQVNTIHEYAALKSTGISDKSAKVGSAESGKVLSSHQLPPEYFTKIDGEREILKDNGKKYPLPDNVYPLPETTN